VLLAQVAVNPHRKGAAVLVAKPTADRGDVHAGFDAGGREEMPEVVVGEVGVSSAGLPRIRPSLPA